MYINPGYRMKPVSFAFVCAFLCSSLVVSANNPDDVVGAWHYVDVHGKEKMDSTGRKMATMFFTGLKFDFKADGSYQATIMQQPDKGTWKLNDDKTALVMSSDRGERKALKILKLTSDTLAMHFGRAVFILERSEKRLDPQAESAASELETTEATSEALCKTWYMKGKERPNQTEKQREMARELSEGTYMVFAADGSYEIELFGFKGEGQWRFDPDNTSIVTEVDGNERIWRVHKISENDLILLKGRTQEQWIFSARE